MSWEESKHSGATLVVFKIVLRWRYLSNTKRQMRMRAAHTPRDDQSKNDLNEERGVDGTTRRRNSPPGMKARQGCGRSAICGGTAT